MNGKPNTILGMRVDPVRIPDVIARLESWIDSGERTHVVTVNTVNTAVLGLYDQGFREVINASDLSLPDGMPLVWLTRLHGESRVGRVCGPEISLAFCEATKAKGYRHYFYGGAEGVAEQLGIEFSRRFPGMEVVGAYSPPFRPVTPEEDQRIVDDINAAKPDVVWVGLGCPKQERWMQDHRERIKAPVVIGVGQVFDLYTGRLNRAPRWMCNCGLEWFYRLLREPRRLWKRYLVYNTTFLFNVFLEELRLREF